ncbi:MAG: hypothetical protein AB7P42_16440 [Gammaproteobacteria bacterium]
MTQAFSLREADTWKTLKTRPDTRHTSADGQAGVLRRSVVDNSHFFRVYQADGSFEDYDLVQDELPIRIDGDAMDAHYRRAGSASLDHHPKVLGRDDESPAE